MNYQFIYKRLGKEIIKIRKQKNISQEELSFDAHVDRSCLSEIEEGKGNPTLRTLLEISRALDIQLSRLLKLVEI